MKRNFNDDTRNSKRIKYDVISDKLKTDEYTLKDGRKIYFGVVNIETDKSKKIIERYIEGQDVLINYLYDNQPEWYGGNWEGALSGMEDSYMDADSFYWISKVPIKEGFYVQSYIKSRDNNVRHNYDNFDMNYYNDILMVMVSGGQVKNANAGFTYYWNRGIHRPVNPVKQYLGISLLLHSFTAKINHDKQFLLVHPMTSMEKVIKDNLKGNEYEKLEGYPPFLKYLEDLEEDSDNDVLLYSEDSGWNYKRSAHLNEKWTLGHLVPYSHRRGACFKINADALRAYWDNKKLAQVRRKGSSKRLWKSAYIRGMEKNKYSRSNSRVFKKR